MKFITSILYKVRLNIFSITYIANFNKSHCIENFTIARFLDNFCFNVFYITCITTSVYVLYVYLVILVYTDNFKIVINFSNFLNFIYKGQRDGPVSAED